MIQARAVVISAPQQVEFRTVELVEPGPGDVVVHTLYSSISAGTERMLLAGRMPHPMLSLPVVPGYETVGRVVWVGDDVAPELEGSLVYVGGARCYQHINPAWGGQSQVLVVDAQRVVPLEALEPAQGVLLALGATALHGVDVLAGAQTAALSGRMLVLGQGPVGQFAARIARKRGAWVAVADQVQARLERSVADAVLDIREGPAAQQLDAPVDMLVDATGSMAAIAGALPILADGGVVLLLGYYDELRLPYMPLFLKQARLLTAREWAPGDLQRTRDMLANAELDAARLLTHRLPIDQIQRAYAVALDDPDCLKLVLEWPA